MPTHSLFPSFIGRLLGGACLSAGLISPAANGAEPGFGRPPTTDEVRAVDIEVRPDGAGLPPGSGNAIAGGKVYAAQCAACHGSTGTEGPRDRLVGGQGSLTTAKPIKTIGSYWQYATTVYDYINRAMPFTAPGTLRPDEVYSLVAFLLYRNDIIGESDVVNQTTLPLIRMPNRDGFVVEPEFRHVTRR